MELIQRFNAIPACARISVPDIDLFFEKRLGKANNDRNNKTREEIFRNIVGIDDEDACMIDPVYGKKWHQVKEKLMDYMRASFHDAQPNGAFDHLVIHKRAGRRFNYDFSVEFMREDRPVHTVDKLEFKVGESISKSPQFFSVGVSNKSFQFLGGLSYTRFFYDRYLPMIHALLLAGGTGVQGVQGVQGIPDIPDFDVYAKAVQGTNYDAHPLFRAMYDMEKNESLKARKTKIVNESISDYLLGQVDQENVDFGIVREKLEASQGGKRFLFWSEGNFREESFSGEAFCLTGEMVRKTSKSTNACNTLQFPVRNGARINFLLRWKNHAGVLLPAWQISYTPAK
jgi:hypothetical protein